MSNPFKNVIERRGTGSVKWDQLEKLFGGADVLPLWVADMDFASPPAVVEAIRKRAEHPVYGYAARFPELAQAYADWWKNRHGWKVDPEWIMPCPGVVPALAASVQALTAPGDKVIVQPPVYGPFFDVVRLNDRELVENPLISGPDGYRIDFGLLEQQMKDGAKLMILCSPHNPVGRVWTEAELLQLGELCERYDVRLVSDEIHADLVFTGNRHIPAASLNEALAARTVTCVSPSKTFNVAGLYASAMIISNPELRSLLVRRMRAQAIGMDHVFAAGIVEACFYRSGEWLDMLLEYLEGNRDFLLGFFASELPRLPVVKPEGTYLAWVDCRSLGLDAAGLKDLMFRKAKTAFNEGSGFGKQGAGHVRINFACPRSTLEEALRRFAAAVRSLEE